MARKKTSRFNEMMEMVPEMEANTRKSIIIILIFLLAILSLLSIFGLAGAFGRYFDRILRLIFGYGFWVFPVIVIVASYLAIRPKKYLFTGWNWFGAVMVIFGYSSLLHLIKEPESYKEILKMGVGGGYLGFAVAYPLFLLMGKWGAIAVSFLALFLTGIIVMFNTSLERVMEKATFKGVREIFGSWFDKLRNKNNEIEEVDGKANEPLEFEEKEIGDGGESEEYSATETAEDDEALDEIIASKKKKKLPRIEIPYNLLNDKSGKPTAGDIRANQETIRKTLQNFGIEVEMVDIAIGPTVTQYTFRPAEGVKLSRIIGLGNDLALALAAHPIRIEAPIPGKSLVGVEVPNEKIAVVPLRKVLEAKEFKDRKTNLSIVLGQDVAGKPWIADLDRLPHLLVAGATNSGKTVCLNAIIISLLFQNQPDEMKLILVDPKRVEFPSYNGIPYLLTPVITDIKKTINALKWTISEMERRFHILQNAGKRNIQSYNLAHQNDKLPYLIFIIDELADLMSIASAEVEAAIIRLAQMSRAVGIHLILATQRPSVDIITGLIKANIPGRIAFAVTSLTDSRTILDVSGAEKLLGRGDMLYMSAEISKPKRLQGAFCSDGDIESVVQFLREKAEPDYEDGLGGEQQTLGLGGVVLSDGYREDSDELLPMAREIIIEAGKASASYLQRRLKIGYARAARLLDLLEEQGVIGPGEGAKPREILIKKGELSLAEQADGILRHKPKFNQQKTGIMGEAEKGIIRDQTAEIRNQTGEDIMEEGGGSKEAEIEENEDLWETEEETSRNQKLEIRNQGEKRGRERGKNGVEEETAEAEEYLEDEIEIKKEKKNDEDKYKF